MLLPQYAVFAPKPFVLTQKFRVLFGHLGLLGNRPNHLPSVDIPTPNRMQPDAWSSRWSARSEPHLV